MEDGQVVGTENEPLSGPMYLVMENSAGGSVGSPSDPGTTMGVQDVEVFQNQQ